MGDTGPAFSGPSLPVVNAIEPTAVQAAMKESGQRRVHAPGDSRYCFSMIAGIASLFPF